jgi:hypothetical protein
MPQLSRSWCPTTNSSSTPVSRTISSQIGLLRSSSSGKGTPYFALILFLIVSVLNLLPGSEVHLNSNINSRWPRNCSQSQVCPSCKI